MDIRILQANDAASFQALRLQALRECPAAFASSYEEERDIPPARVAERLSPTPERAVFGAFDHAALIGTAGLQRERAMKLSHKAFIWGVYVAPEHRQRGIGRLLLQAALEHATLMPGLRQVNLGAGAAKTASTALYKAAGFEPFGLEKDFLLVDGVPYDEVHMTRRIAP